MGREIDQRFTKTGDSGVESAPVSSELGSDVSDNNSIDNSGWESEEAVMKLLAPSANFGTGAFDEMVRE